MRIGLSQFEDSCFDDFNLLVQTLVVNILTAPLGDLGEVKPLPEFSHEGGKPALNIN
jgi:hypothetical protein